MRVSRFGKSWEFKLRGVCRGGLKLGNSTVHRTVTLAAPLLLTNGMVRYEAVLYSCGTSPVGGLRGDL